jgi:hypothetical protein
MNVFVVSEKPGSASHFATHKPYSRKAVNLRQYRVLKNVLHDSFYDAETRSLHRTILIYKSRIIVGIRYGILYRDKL